MTEKVNLLKQNKNLYSIDNNSDLDKNIITDGNEKPEKDENTKKIEDEIVVAKLMGINKIEPKYNSKPLFKKLSVGKKNGRENKKDDMGKNKKNEKNNKETKHRVDNFMDISILNNRNDDTKFDDNSKGDNLGVMTQSNIWDISAINPKDVSFISKKG